MPPRSLLRVVESECVGTLTLQFRRASFVRVLKRSDRLLSSKVSEDCRVWACASLGEVRAVSPVDRQNGQHPVWHDATFKMDVSDPSVDLRITLWHEVEGKEDELIGRVLIPLTEIINNKESDALDVNWWDILPVAPKERGGEKELKYESIVQDTPNSGLVLPSPPASESMEIQLQPSQNSSQKSKDTKDGNLVGSILGKLFKSNESEASDGALGEHEAVSLGGRGVGLGSLQLALRLELNKTLPLLYLTAPPYQENIVDDEEYSKVEMQSAVDRMKAFLEMKKQGPPVLMVLLDGRMLACIVLSWYFMCFLAPRWLWPFFGALFLPILGYATSIHIHRRDMAQVDLAAEGAANVEAGAIPMRMRDKDIEHEYESDGRQPDKLQRLLKAAAVLCGCKGGSGRSRGARGHSGMRVGGKSEAQWAAIRAHPQAFASFPRGYVARSVSTGAVEFEWAGGGIAATDADAQTRGMAGVSSGAVSEKHEFGLSGGEGRGQGHGHALKMARSPLARGRSRVRVFEHEVEEVTEEPLGAGTDEKEEHLSVAGGGRRIVGHVMEGVAGKMQQMRNRMNWYQTFMANVQKHLLVAVSHAEVVSATHNQRRIAIAHTKQALLCAAVPFASVLCFVPAHAVLFFAGAVAISVPKFLATKRLVKTMLGKGERYLEVRIARARGLPSGAPHTFVDVVLEGALSPKKDGTISKQLVRSCAVMQSTSTDPEWHQKFRFKVEKLEEATALCVNVYGWEPQEFFMAAKSEFIGTLRVPLYALQGAAQSAFESEGMGLFDVRTAWEWAAEQRKQQCLLDREKAAVGGTATAAAAAVVAVNDGQTGAATPPLSESEVEAAAAATCVLTESVTLAILLDSAMGLAAADISILGFGGKSDPYVNVYYGHVPLALGLRESQVESSSMALEALMQDCHLVGRSQVRDTTLDPVWRDELFMLELRPRQALGYLLFVVYDQDFGTEDDFLGLVCVPPAQVKALAESEVARVRQPYSVALHEHQQAHGQAEVRILVPWPRPKDDNGQVGDEDGDGKAAKEVDEEDEEAGEEGQQKRKPKQEGQVERSLSQAFNQFMTDSSNKHKVKVQGQLQFRVMAVANLQDAEQDSCHPLWDSYGKCAEHQRIRVSYGTHGHHLPWKPARRTYKSSAEARVEDMAGRVADEAEPGARTGQGRSSGGSSSGSSSSYHYHYLDGTRRQRVRQSRLSEEDSKRATDALYRKHWESASVELTRVFCDLFCDNVESLEAKRRQRGGTTAKEQGADEDRSKDYTQFTLPAHLDLSAVLQAQRLDLEEVHRVSAVLALRAEGNMEAEAETESEGRVWRVLREAGRADCELVVRWRTYCGVVVRVFSELDLLTSADCECHHLGMGFPTGAVVIDAGGDPAAAAATTAPLWHSLHRKNIRASEVQAAWRLAVAKSKPSPSKGGAAGGARRGSLALFKQHVSPSGGRVGSNDDQITGEGDEQGNRTGVDGLGQLQLALRWVNPRGLTSKPPLPRPHFLLSIRRIKATGLIASDAEWLSSKLTSSDPYVRIHHSSLALRTADALVSTTDGRVVEERYTPGHVLGTSSKEIDRFVETGWLSNTLEPEWAECFQWKLREADLKKPLTFRVFDWDHADLDDLIGERIFQLQLVEPDMPASIANRKAKAAFAAAKAEAIDKQQNVAKQQRQRQRQRQHVPLELRFTKHQLRLRAEGGDRDMDRGVLSFEMSLQQLDAEDAIDDSSELTGSGGGGNGGGRSGGTESVHVSAWRKLKGYAGAFLAGRCTLDEMERDLEALLDRTVDRVASNFWSRVPDEADNHHRWIAEAAKHDRSPAEPVAALASASVGKHPVVATVDAAGSKDATTAAVDNGALDTMDAVDAVDAEDAVDTMDTVDASGAKDATGVDAVDVFGAVGDMGAVKASQAKPKPIYQKVFDRVATTSPTRAVRISAGTAEGATEKTATNKANDSSNITRASFSSAPSSENGVGSNSNRGRLRRAVLKANASKSFIVRHPQRQAAVSSLASVPEQVARVAAATLVQATARRFVCRLRKWKMDAL